MDSIGEAEREHPNGEVSEVTAVRKDLQLGRRFFHMSGGFGVVLIYGIFFTYSQIVQFLGTAACIVYIFDRCRVVYPEIARKFEGMTRFFLRAEERLQESTMIPYILAVLLTVISFPKPVAIFSILTLAFADPVSAIVGIRYGSRHLVPNKTVEGSLAFFITAFFCCLGVLLHMTGAEVWRVVMTSLLLAASGALFEMLPIKLDDNLTIPLFMGFVGLGFCRLMGVALGG